MITLAIVLIIIVLIYVHSVRNFDYWKKRGVKHDKPIVFFGTVKSVYLRKKSITQSIVELYFKHPKEKVVGAFRSTSPALLIRDPELIKHVLITDFSYFYKRGILPGKGIEPLLRNLFFGEGDLWRLLRQRITPAFTSGKLKAMFPLIIERAEQLQARTLNAAHEGRVIDARELMARYTTDFIGACGFGLDAGSLNDENSVFRKLGIDIFHFGLRESIVLFLKDIFPDMTKHLKFFGRLENRITSLVNDIQKQRNYQPSNRNDFIDLLLECKKKGAMKGESLENFNSDGTPKESTIELDDIIIAAQVFVFFAAGFETSSSATSFTLHQLAYHPQVQNKVHKEIDNILSQHDGKLNYDAINEMKYLGFTFKEGMRMFPSLGYLFRKCTKKYTFAKIDVSIDAGVEVTIPVQALHNDPKYWNKPNEFRPERFKPEEFTEINKAIYLPFGSGPRSCIAYAPVSSACAQELERFWESVRDVLDLVEGNERVIMCGDLNGWVGTKRVSYEAVLGPYGDKRVNEAGERLGLMQSLAGLAAVLSRFTVEPAPHSKRHPSVEKKPDVVQSIDGGLPLIFRERKKVM